jgi:carbon monoxide dehydrogenase subunit G
MDLTGKYEIPASAREVWDALNDPQILAACVPGCDSLEKQNPNDFLAAATLKIGPMRATFKGKLTLSEQDPPRRCVVRGEGKGGPAGFVKGEAEVLLDEKNGITTLSYTARATIGGKLAQIGQRLIDGAARQIADDFFGRFAKLLTQGKTPSEMAATGENTPLEASRGQLPPRKRRYAKVWIGVGVAAAAAAVAFLFARRR